MKVKKLKNMAFLLYLIVLIAVTLFALFKLGAIKVEKERIYFEPEQTQSYETV